MKTLQILLHCSRMSGLLLLLIRGGCAMLARQALDERFRPADPTHFDQSTPPPQGMSYRADV